MTTFNRWCLVALGMILVIAVPVVVHHRPVGEIEISGTQLLGLVQKSQQDGWSGYVETTGTLQIPVTSRFTDIGDLFGETTRLRVWWRDTDNWRVDKLLTAGETDTVHTSTLTTSYDYEDARATRSVDPDIRLPRSADLVPPVLAERVLRDVDPAEVSRLPTRRVAGIVAPGLRLSPTSEQSSIDHVDLWADPASGVPLRLEVYDAAAGSPGFVTEFRDFSRDRPSAANVAFTPTAGTDVSFEGVLDIADAANQYAPLTPPDSVAGLAKAESSVGAVGVYGSGITELIAIPLRAREAGALRDQFESAPTAVSTEAGTVLGIGPLGVVLSGAGNDGGWLVAGTVTRPTLLAAVRDLLSGTTFDQPNDRDGRGGR